MGPLTCCVRNCAPLVRLGPTVPPPSLLPVRDPFFNLHSDLNLGTILGCARNCAPPVWLGPTAPPTSLLPVRDQFCNLYFDLDLGTAVPFLAQLYEQFPGWVTMRAAQRRRLVSQSEHPCAHPLRDVLSCSYWSPVLDANDAVTHVPPGFSPSRAMAQ
eukprot:1528715-Rhodomonas_salina.1